MDPAVWLAIFRTLPSAILSNFADSPLAWLGAATLVLLVFGLVRRDRVPAAQHDARRRR